MFRKNVVFTIRGKLGNNALASFLQYFNFVILIRLIRHCLKFVPMNRVYPYVFTVVYIIVNLLPRISFAQCNCSPGHPATAIDYSVNHSGNFCIFHYCQLSEVQSCDWHIGLSDRNGYRHGYYDDQCK